MRRPWEDRALINAACEIAFDVRDIDVDDVAPADLVARIPPERLADLIVTMAAMIDVDEPLSALQRWQHADFFGLRPAWRPLCTVGHDAGLHGYMDHWVQHCALCDREMRARRARDAA